MFVRCSDEAGIMAEVRVGIILMHPDNYFVSGARYRHIQI